MFVNPYQSLFLKVTMLLLFSSGMTVGMLAAIVLDMNHNEFYVSCMLASIVFIVFNLMVTRGVAIGRLGLIGYAVVIILTSLGTFLYAIIAQDVSWSTQQYVFLCVGWGLGSVALYFLFSDQYRELIVCQRKIIEQRKFMVFMSKEQKSAIREKRSFDYDKVEAQYRQKHGIDQ